MKLGYHIVISSLTSAGFAYATRSFWGTLICFASGILIDMDHVLDFCIANKRMCWRYSELDSYCREKKDGTIYLIFHSYELTVLLWSSYIFFKNTVWLGFLVGITVHLLIDQIFNGTYRYAYLWYCRKRFGFPKEIFFRDEFYKKFNPK